MTLAGFPQRGSQSVFYDSSNCKSNLRLIKPYIVSNELNVCSSYQFKCVLISTFIFYKVILTFDFVFKCFKEQI